MDKFLVKNKNSSGDFWNRYKDSSLSDYYQEISKGAFHVTGESRHLKMYHTWNYYKDTVFYNGFLTEIYQRLGADTTINWEKFPRSMSSLTDNIIDILFAGLLAAISFVIIDTFSPKKWRKLF